MLPLIRCWSLHVCHQHDDYYCFCERHASTKLCLKLRTRGHTQKTSHTHTRTHKHTHSNTDTHTHHKRTHNHMAYTHHTQTHTHTFCTHAQGQEHTHTHIHIARQTNTHTHKHIHCFRIFLWHSDQKLLFLEWSAANSAFRNKYSLFVLQNALRRAYIACIRYQSS